MPMPHDGESHDDFIKRCIPMVMEEGTAEDSDQAVAICNSMWEQAHDTEQSADPQEVRGMNYMRAFCERKEEPGEEGAPIRFVASTEGIKRDGKELRAENWRLDNYKRNPVVLWVHDYLGQNLPIGRADVAIDGRQLVADVSFDQQDDFARQVESKYRRGFLSAVSVGWQDVGEGKRTYHDLMDVSAVPVPADPMALKLQEARVLRDFAREIEALTREPAGKATIGNWLEAGIHSDFTMRADYLFSEGKIDREERLALSDAIGNGLNMVAEALDSINDLRTRPFSIGGIFGFMGTSEANTRAALSDVDAWTGVASAMLALYRPDSAMEDEARHGIYIALERAYRKLGKTAPEWRTADELEALSDAELRGLFLEDEYQRVGAVLNSRNRGDLTQAIELIQGVLSRATKEEEPRTATEPSEAEPDQQRAAIYSLHELFNKEFPK